jgi:DNA mismatch repair protein MutL
MSNIRILPENVANQIAAGEVIERPASVVRELLDNSIDAGADRVNIKIEEGGKRLIRLHDNGSGMDRDDMLLALERHATSKISTVSDIFSIRTLGFRGEALPSICSVSKMEITSRTSDQLTAHRLKAQGGEFITIDEVGAPAGTTIEVRDLYYNTPARRKFLKADKTETGHIIDTISRIALPFTGLQLRLDDTRGKTLLNLPASENELNRLTALFGRDVSLSLIDTYFEANGFEIKAYLSPPDYSRARGDRIYIYVNNRNIRDKLVIRAIMEGYGQRLMKGRYPQVALFIKADPMLVDINVHPAKQEVRFDKGQFVYRAILSGIDKALKDQLNPFSFETSTVSKNRYAGEISLDKEIKEAAKPEWEYSIEPSETKELVDKSIIEQEHLIKERPRIIGSLKDTYLLFQDGNGLLMIDQHAAHERIVYETLKKKYHASKVECQHFLIPVSLELSIKEGRILEEKLDQLSHLGFDIEHFGGNSFILRSVPAILVNTDWESFLKDLIPVLEDTDDILNDVSMDKILTVIACHGAVRAGHRLSEREMALMMDQLTDLELPTNCPHGRPVFKKFTYSEIERMFKRIT